MDAFTSQGMPSLRKGCRHFARDAVTSQGMPSRRKGCCLFARDAVTSQGMPSLHKGCRNVARDAVSNGGSVVLHMFEGFAHHFEKWRVVELCPGRSFRNIVNWHTFDSRVTI
ncbi:hypothetical protein LSAT2_026235 [Lamellibrachia satsuma]|nr:hypothetical protein LSAT2_026235 [Lamellibrachia satsuma]